MADRSRMLQVLRNLLVNAMKYSPPRSVIGLWAAAGSAEVVFGVDDEGPGIHPADQDKLFQRFSRLPMGDASVPGSGLGLYISRKIVESHGGRIWVASEVGSGSSFRFSIPLANREPESEGQLEVTVDLTTEPRSPVQ